jgi:hypothetical protein
LSSCLSKRGETPLCCVKFVAGNDSPEDSIATIGDFITSNIRRQVLLAFQTQSKHSAVRLPTNILAKP